MRNMLLALSLLAISSLAAAAPQCPPLDSPRFLLPHETDCSKFYICAHGTPVLQTCPEGTHFNPIFMVCQNPVFAGCESTPPDSSLPCSWTDFIVHRPHPESCSKYYVCEFGTVQVFDCPQGLEFNAELQECVWPHESNCNITQDVQTDSSQDSCQSGVLSSHEECNKYNICDNGANVAMDCANGLQWSSKLEQCVWPQESDCGVPQDVEQDASQNGGSQDGEPQEGCQPGALSRHKECGKFYVCDNGKNVALNCANGLQWSSKLEQCVWPHESDCGQDNADEAVQDGAQDGGQDGCEEGALSANRECSKYNVCSHSVLVAMDCPEGLQWSSKLTQCVWPHDSDCGQADSDDAAQDGAQDGVQDGVQDGAKDDCVEGALSANKDCSKYNVCNNGELLSLDCPAGLHWNAKLSFCDWPVAAACA